MLVVTTFNFAVGSGLIFIESLDRFTEAMLVCFTDWLADVGYIILCPTLVNIFENNISVIMDN